ncbi:hypothetical protein [Paucilactobacillus vaccinostercus]|jgi:hypothetical protein|nr:hypothetical protein [Paucilactobacillus vaccinostercus]
MVPFLVIVLVLLFAAGWQFYSNNLKKQQNGKHFADQTYRDAK